MGPYPQHRIDLVFLKHRVPSGLINLQLAQLEIVTEHCVGISGGCSAIHENRYGASIAKDQNSTEVPVVQKPRMRKVRFKIKNILPRKHLRKSKSWIDLHINQRQSACRHDPGNRQ